MGEKLAFLHTSPLRVNYCYQHFTERALTDLKSNSASDGEKKKFEKISQEILKIFFQERLFWGT